MEEKKNKCLWCNTELPDGEFFCKGGGNTIGISNTGEKTFTKSYCFDSFLTMFKQSIRLQQSLIKQENQYLLWKDQIKDWYKSIPMIYESEVTKCTGQPKKIIS